MGCTDHQGRGAVFIRQPHTEPPAAHADPDDLADRLVGKARGGPEQGRGLLWAGAPGADPARLAAVTVIVGACRAEHDGGRRNRHGRHATAKQISPVESETRRRISAVRAARRPFGTHRSSSLELLVRYRTMLCAWILMSAQYARQ